MKAAASNQRVKTQQAITSLINKNLHAYCLLKAQKNEKKAGEKLSKISHIGLSAYLLHQLSKAEERKA